MKKFVYNINPAPGVGVTEWYLMAINDLTNRLRKYEDVELIGQERIDLVMKHNLEERLIAIENMRQDSLESLQAKYKYSDASKDEVLAEVDKLEAYYDDLIDRVKTNKPIDYSVNFEV